MIKLRDELKPVRVYGQDRPSDMYAPRVILSTTKVEDDPLNQRSCHRMDARIGVMFWANDAEFERARENAERQVLSIAYAEVLTALRAARSALFASDPKAALHIIDDLESELMKP